MIAVSIFWSGHTVYIYIDTLIKYGYICIYVSSNFILCASLLIPKTNKTKLSDENGYFLTNPKLNRNVKIISDKSIT